MTSGATLLSLGVMHLLVDAVADWVQEETHGHRRLEAHEGHEGHDMGEEASDITADGIAGYPNIFVIFLAGIVFPILLQLLTDAIGGYYEEKSEKATAAITIEEGKPAPSRDNVYIMKFLLTLGSIVLHSILIGLGLGSMGADEIISVEALLIALCFHQFFEGFSVGCLLTELHSNHGIDISACFKWCSVLVFSLSTALGIAVAKGTLEAGINNTSAGFNAFAGGVLVSAALGEVIFPEIMKASPSDKYSDKLLIIAAIIFGNGIMSMLAIWA
jgi:zinc transporter ZupT